MAKETRQKIKKLIANVPSKETRLIAAAAVYFKGLWLSQFPKAHTKDRPFTTAAGDKVTVPMMNVTAPLGYLEAKDFQALELPYKGGKLSMVVLLPKKADGLAALEKSLSPKTPGLRPGSLPVREVVVHLPRFKLTTSVLLDPALKALGMIDAFLDRQRADFSGMDGSREFFVSAAFHKAVVEVSEEGTEAAAATAVAMPRGMPPAPVVFNADRPFIFFVRDRVTGSLLFVGRVMNPKK